MFRIILLTLLSSISAATAQACECQATTFLKNYDSSDYVFLGKVKEANDQTASFETIKTWKGHLKTSISQAEGKDCNHRFSTSEKYLIFASKQEDGKVKASNCAGTRNLNDKDATKLIEKLNFGE